MLMFLSVSISFATTIFLVHSLIIVCSFILFTFSVSEVDWFYPYLILRCVHILTEEIGTSFISFHYLCLDLNILFIAIFTFHYALSRNFCLIIQNFIIFSLSLFSLVINRCLPS